MATALLVISFVTLIVEPLLVAAQNCYYPDGSLSTEGVAACSSQGGACCPLNWQCMSNGLCYLEAEGYYGRYSCTDRTWASPDCPQFCKTGESAPGNEAVLWCPNGDFCCDGDRVSGNCCKQADAVSFSLPDPTPIAFISRVPSPTPVSSYAGNSPASSSSFQSLDSSSTLSSTSTVTHESTTTDNNGAESTVTQILTVGPSHVAPSTTSDPTVKHKTSNTGMIAGLAAGLPLFLIIAGILLFFFIRHIRKSNQLHQPPNPPPPITEVQYKNIPPGTHAHETDGSPIAFGRTKSGRTSELYGSDAYVHSPNPSISTTFSGPPQYSNSQTSPDGKKSTPGMTSINEEPAELWSGPVYRAYRPPPGHADS